MHAVSEALVAAGSSVAKSVLGDAEGNQRDVVKNLMQNRRMICVSYHLPVILRRSSQKPGHWSAQWDPDSFIARGEKSLADYVEMIWIGMVTRECLDRVTSTEQARTRRASVSSSSSSKGPRDRRAASSGGLDAQDASFSPKVGGIA